MHGEAAETLEGSGPRYTDKDTGVTVQWAGRLRTPQGMEPGPYLTGLYARHGAAFAEHIEGGFALALHDSKAPRTLLARDAAGTVPLYYAESTEGQLLFAVRIGDLLPRLKDTRLNAAALLDYLTFVWSLDGKTFFEGVQLLPAGAVLDNGRVKSYFTFEHHPENRSEETWCEEIIDTLKQVVLPFAQPGVGCHLSGGIDSSLMAVLLAELAGMPPQAYVAAFPDYARFDESPYGQLVADQIGAAFTRVIPQAEDFPEALTGLMRAAEEPKCHPPVFPRYLLEAAAHQAGHRIMVSGRGADELFTGYDSHKQASLNGHRARRTLFDPAQRARLLRASFIKAVGYEPETAYDAIFAACPGDTLLERALAFDFRTLMANWLTLDYKLSTHFGTEPVAPFLDRRVIDLALRIPVEVKCADDQPKALLKRAVRGLVPDAIIDRAKVGFRTPMGEMLREGLEPHIRAQLREDTGFFWELFDPAGVAAVVEEHFTGTRNNGWQIWTLLCVREWCRLHIDKEGGEV